MNETMRAVQIAGYGQPMVFTAEAPIPQPGPGELLVRVRASGLCSTDLHLQSGVMDLGTLPRVLGHEVVGEVAACGEGVTGWDEGQRAIVAIDVTCGRCQHCLSGQTQRCPNKQRIGFERDGGHADFVVVPAANLIPAPAAIGDAEAAILADAVACMYHSLISRGHLIAGDRVVILGVGGLGIHGIQIARLAGASVLGTSRRPDRLAAARSYGAEVANPDEQSLAEAVEAFTGGEGADIVADCIGTQASIREGLSMLRPGGKLLVIAYLDREFLIPSVPLFLPEREIIGCRGASMTDLLEVVHLVAGGRLQPVVGASYRLEEIHTALQRLERGDLTGRIVLTR